MSQAFSNVMLTAFGATTGAYSKVTKDEYNKSQITLVGPEQKIAEVFLGDRLAKNQGSIRAIKASGYDPEIEFHLHPIGRPIRLTLSYKTGKPNELRLYLRADSFKPSPGENWCIFVRDDKLWIGQFGEWLRTEVQAGKLSKIGQRSLPEPEEDGFQDDINALPPEQITSTIKRWQRDTKVSANALRKSGYICELAPELPVFTAKGSGLPFLEAHHLIPMKIQGDFPENSLDVTENVCILNPLMHRRLHHGVFTEIVPDLERLIFSRRPLLDRLGLLPDDVLRLYE